LPTLCRLVVTPSMVGISLLTLVPGVFGGSATYAAALLGALSRVGELEYEVFVPTIARDAGDGFPTTVVDAYRASRGPSGRVAAMARATVFPGSVRRQLGLERLDALHYPLTVMVPTVPEPPTVTTVHDVLHVVYPRFFTWPELAYRRLIYRRLARTSRLVIAPSEHSKELLVDRVGVSPERIRVIAHGVDRERFSPGSAPRKPFLFYPADFYPHKNHERLLDAFALVRRSRPELRLVLAGGGLERLQEAPGVDARARISTDQLVELYRTAAALVFPSLHETFGLPPLEAMACRCPVASSTAGSLPEVCGDGARYFDPTSPEEMAEVVDAVLADPIDLSLRGLKRVERFGWDRAAKAHDAVYRELTAPQ
jgi:glycosyltransferase involved in cell wall biosynthesis